MPRLSVVIPAYRAEAHLPACLDALAAQEGVSGDDFEVIVVDDASPDGTADVARAAPGVRLEVHGCNRGAAAARNTGAAAASPDAGVLLFVDSDVVPAPTLVAGTIAAFDVPSVAAATGRYDPEPANDARFARYKALWTFWCWERSAATSGTSSHLQGALAAIRRDLFEEVGGFDESFAGGSVEDYELSARVRAAGHAIAFDDRLRGRHHFPGFATVARNYWARARSWTALGPARRGAFSSGQASRRSAVAALGALAGSVGAATFPIGAPVAAAGTAAWLAAASPFLLWVARREGPAFAAYAATVHFGLSAIAGAGAAVEAPRMFFKSNPWVERPTPGS